MEQDSMPMSNGKNTVSRDQDRKHKKILAECLKDPGNKLCADCQGRGPTWASVNLGVFVCLTCSGIHRSMGVHISQVRSTTLDTWLPKQVAFVAYMGNTKANKFWEHSLPPTFVRPRDTQQIANFIKYKYIEKQYCPRGEQPPTIKNFDENSAAAVKEIQEEKSVSPKFQNSKNRTTTISRLAPTEEVVIETKQNDNVVSKAGYPMVDFLGLNVTETTGDGEWANFQDTSSINPMMVVGSPCLSWSAFEGPPALNTQNTEGLNGTKLDTTLLFTGTEKSINTGRPATPPAAAAVSKLHTTEDILKLYDAAPAPNGHMSSCFTTSQQQQHLAYASNYQYNMPYIQQYQGGNSNGSYMQMQSFAQGNETYHQQQQQMVAVATVNGGYMHNMNSTANPWDVKSNSGYGTGQSGSNGQGNSSYFY